MKNKSAIKNCKNDSCARRLMNKIVHYINSAKKSIHVAMFSLNNRQLANIIINANKRGVKVYIVLDKLKSKDQNLQYNRLQEAGKRTFIAQINQLTK